MCYRTQRQQKISGSFWHFQKKLDEFGRQSLPRRPSFGGGGLPRRRLIDRRQERGFGWRRRRRGLVSFPSASQRLVERHELGHQALLGDRVLVLQVEELPLGVEHVQEISQAIVVSLRG